MKLKFEIFLNKMELFSLNLKMLGNSEIIYNIKKEYITPRKSTP